MDQPCICPNSKFKHAYHHHILQIFLYQSLLFWVSELDVSSIRILATIYPRFPVIGWTTFWRFSTVECIQMNQVRSHTVAGEGYQATLILELWFEPLRSLSSERHLLGWSWGVQSAKTWKGLELQSWIRFKGCEYNMMVDPWTFFSQQHWAEHWNSAAVLLDLVFSCVY